MSLFENLNEQNGVLKFRVEQKNRIMNNVFGSTSLSTKIIAFGKPTYTDVESLLFPLEIPKEENFGYQFVHSVDVL